MIAKSWFSKPFLYALLAFSVLQFAAWPNAPFIQDENVFAPIAQLVAQGHVFDSEFNAAYGKSGSVTPGIILLAGVGAWLNNELTPLFARAFSVLAGFAILFLAFKIARSYGFDETHAAITAFFVATLPQVFETSHLLYSDAIALAFMLAALVFFDRYAAKPGWTPLLVGTFLAVAGFYVRQTAIAVLALPLVLVIFDRSKRREIPRVLLMFLIAALLVAPWLFYVHDNFGQWLAPTPHELDLSVLAIAKIPYVLAWIGFVSLPAAMLLAGSAWRRKDHVMLGLFGVFAFLALLLFASGGWQFLNSGKASVWGSLLDVRGRIPILYHLLPNAAYVALTSLFTIAGAIIAGFWAKSGFDSAKRCLSGRAEGSCDHLELLLLAFSFIGILLAITKGGPGVPASEARYVIPALPFAVITMVRVLKGSRLVAWLAVPTLVGFAWMLALFSFAFAQQSAVLYTNTLAQSVPGSCVYTNAPSFYASYSTCDNDKARFALVASGFAEQTSLQGFVLDREFKASLFGKSFSGVSVYRRAPA
ncbi:MAG TPA: glycosyltransferase family 39 protein [Candidatus Norongarragalinales archaeon]|jgi:4-amino-4-deoxy-L-arabinose transferase-like glycosyltransferase|nr:glycosyltransferase family 39 protein [Candidatus Norongarragalinales archaeon]